ncbi:YceI family protein [Pseudoduganella buxea]|uniref:YceI family protein n=1 Tax=Pseudoduganella buxea TaxID=1949069 RepID=A0A6I3SWD7_9BURK|nr:YceI family protein [Pseudoduganella buxea]MTV52592.1 YceI family protein [Pseudoduganella buxea]GGB87461.1 hypothetical protein GCM10011572_06870 [Pseudoduganella buxea]
MRIHPGAAIAALSFSALALSACTLAPPPAVTAPPPAAVAVPTPVAGALTIDGGASIIAITVRRGGPLARLGHDHVVAARTIEGRVDPAANRASLRFRLDALTVDEAPLRQQAGLDTQPGEDAIAGTRRNMLTKVLDAERFPWVDVAIERPAAGGPLATSITLHGVTRRYQVPATVVADGGTVRATGSLTLRQTDFGLVPFAVLGGAMAVQDALELRFDIVAR